MLTMFSTAFPDLPQLISAAVALPVPPGPPPGPPPPSAPATLQVPDSSPSSTSAADALSASIPVLSAPTPAHTLQVPDSSPSSTSVAASIPSEAPSEAPPPETLQVPDSSPSSMSAPPPTTVPAVSDSREATTNLLNDKSLLSFDAASHAERNPDGITQTSRTLAKLTDAQKATRKIRQETERHAQELLSKDLDGLLTRHREELEELAERHGKKVEAIDKLMTSGHYKHKRSVNIENAKIHMKSQEVNAGKSSSSPVLAISILSIFINRSKHGGPSTTA